jgi:hypothetical protein
MPIPTMILGDQRIEIWSPMRPIMRILLALLAIFPLIAPYELIIRVGWQDYINPFFLFSAAISAGAIALSVFLVFTALAGLSSKITLDKPSSTLTHSLEAPVIRRTQQSYPLASIGHVRTVSRDWSDGSPSYHLEISLIDGTMIESGSSWSRGEIDTICAYIERFLAKCEES